MGQECSDGDSLQGDFSVQTGRNCSILDWRSNLAVRPVVFCVANLRRRIFGGNRHGMRSLLHFKKRMTQFVLYIMPITLRCYLPVY